MAEPKLKLEAGKFYHVYNRGINSCNIFREEENYRYFMSLYYKNITPIAETFAWALLPNHFHFLIRIHDDLVLQLDENLGNSASSAAITSATSITSANAATSDRVLNSVAASSASVLNSVGGLNAVGGSGGAAAELNPSIQFSKLFNAYAQAFNKRFNRHGSLFERPFRRKLIEDDDYFKSVLMYIHNNPVNHGFCNNILNYQWSSYLEYVYDDSEFFDREIIVQLFDSIPNFKFVHEHFESEGDYEIND